jgi:RNA polymerase sigma-70 factor, ECF subfamily
MSGVAVDVIAGTAAGSDGRVMTAAAEDSALVAAFRGGDVAAFETIYRLHHRYVQLQARRVISDAHRAEDIAQEAFLRLVRQLLTTNGEIRLRAWLHRTTTNLAIDEHRRTRTMQQYQDHGSPIDELHKTLEHYDQGHPERMIEQGEVRDTIARVIDHLPLRYRRILALRELEGLDYPSIAAAMELSLSAVESLLFRARRRFTEVYQELTDEPAPSQRRRLRTPPPTPVRATRP